MVPRSTAARQLVAVAILFGPLVSLARASEREALLATWQKRQSAAGTLDAAWRSSRSMERRYAQTLALAQTLPAGAPARPDDWVNFAGRLRFVTDGDRVRLEFSGSVPAPETAEPTPEEMVEVMSAGHRKTLFTVGGLGFPVCYEKPATDFMDQRVVPLLWALRPLDPRRPLFEVASLRETGETRQVDGCRCLVFRHARGEVWVDPARGYVPVQCRELRNNREARHISINYGRHEALGWVPTSWSNVKFAPNGKTIDDSLIAQEVRVQVSLTFAPEMFDVELPLGTWVNRLPTDENYIVRANGNRPVLPGEFDGTNYLALLNSDPLSAGRGRAMMAGAGGLMGLAALGWLVASRFRRRRATP